MHCSNGLGIPGSKCRFLHLSTNNPITNPRPFLHLPRTQIPFRSFEARAKNNDGFVKDVSFYELLGIPERGTLQDIKQAYKQLARKYHPDVSPPDRVEEYTERFIQVQEAYETLSDPRRRALYDRDMAKGLHFALSARRRYQYNQEMEERIDWKNHWQVQLSELKRRSMNKDARGNMSWWARMRRQREETSKEL